MRVSVVVAVLVGSVAHAETRDAGSAAGSGTAPTAAQIEQARQQVLDEHYQRELPRYAKGSGAGGDRALPLPGRKAGGPLEDTRASPDAQEPVGASSLASALMWGLVIVVAGLLMFWLGDELFRFGGDAELAGAGEPEAPTSTVAQAVIERPLGDADELARHGQFAEAIHTLLLRTLQELARHSARSVGPAWTSRELLAKIVLGDDTRAALAGLITAVEITHFGAAPADASDYERCRQQFQVFAAAFRGTGRPAKAAA